MKLNVLIWNILDGRNQSVDFLIEYLEDHPEIQLVGLTESFGENNIPDYFTSTFTRVNKNRDDIIKEIYERFPELKQPHSGYSFRNKPTHFFLREGSQLSVSLKFATSDASIYLYHIKPFDLSSHKSIVFGLAHLKSKFYMDSQSQSRMINRTIDEYLSLERKIEHEVGINNRSVLVGDFNANPYKRVLFDYDCLNATPSRWLAKNESVQHGSKEYPFFYNPSWKLMLDDHRVNKEIASVGTFTYESALKPQTTSQKYWNTFDQVLVRPNLIDYFVDDEFKVITRHGHRELISEGRIDKTNYSDHLPIVFTLEL